MSIIFLVDVEPSLLPMSMIMITSNMITILTHMETLLPMSVGMSMQRFSSSPGKSRAMLYMFLVLTVNMMMRRRRMVM